MFPGHMSLAWCGLCGRITTYFMMLFRHVFSCICSVFLSKQVGVGCTRWFSASCRPSSHVIPGKVWFIDMSFGSICGFQGFLEMLFFTMNTDFFFPQKRHFTSKTVFWGHPPEKRCHYWVRSSHLLRKAGTFMPTSPAIELYQPHRLKHGTR